MNKPFFHIQMFAASHWAVVGGWVLRQTLFILLIFIGYIPHAQNIDSLKLALKNANHDTVRCNVLSWLSETAPEGEWEKYNEQLLKLSEQKIRSASGKELIKYKNYLETCSFFCYQRAYGRRGQNN